MLFKHIIRWWQSATLLCVVVLAALKCPAYPDQIQLPFSGGPFPGHTLNLGNLAGGAGSGLMNLPAVTMPHTTGNVPVNVPALPTFSTPSVVPNVNMPAVPTFSAPNVVPSAQAVQSVTAAIPAMVQTPPNSSLALPNIGAASPVRRTPTPVLPAAKHGGIAGALAPRMVSDGAALPASQPAVTVYSATLAQDIPGIRPLPAAALVQVTAPPTGVPASLLTTPASDVQQAAQGIYRLNSGEILVSTTRQNSQAAIETLNGTRVSISKPADVLISSSGGTVRVQNLSGTGNAVSVQYDPHSAPVALDPGVELTTSPTPVSAAQVIPADNVPRRNAVVVNNGQFGVSELFLPSLLKSSALITSLRNSTSTVERRLFNRIMKTAAALTVVRGTQGFEQRALKRVNALSATDTIPHQPLPVVAPQTPAAASAGTQLAQSNQAAQPVSRTATQPPLNVPAAIITPALVDQTRPLIQQSLAQLSSLAFKHRPVPSTETRARSPGLPSQQPLPSAPANAGAAGSSSPNRNNRQIATAIGASVHGSGHVHRPFTPLSELTPKRLLGGVPKALVQEIEKHPDITAAVVMLFAILLAITAYLGRTARVRALELARINRQLELARDQAIESSRLKSEFVANISHEIRTPISAVLGTIALLFETPLDEKQREIAEILRESARSLLAVINDILDFSKMEAGKLRIEMIDFSPRVLLKEIHDAMAGAAADKHLKLSVHAASDLPDALQGDPYRLRQVLMNLIGNAIKFTSTGEIAVGAEPQHTDDGKVWLRFSVKDTGIGIAEENKARLFQPFVQADGSTTRQFGGTGLGLSISKRLIELMGGTIDFRSTVGEGSEFWFVMPFQKGARPQPEGASALEQPQTASAPVLTKRILVAEDNKVLQRIVKAQLDKLGYHADVVSNGAEAVQAVSTGQYALVLMDWQMPELDGLQATKAIRELEPDRANVPIVAMTANAMEGDRSACLSAGMNDYISKPFSVQQLKEMIDRWLGT